MHLLWHHSSTSPRVRRGSPTRSSKGVGARLLTARQAKGLSQAALAHAVDMDRSYVSGLERGEFNVSLISLAKLARVTRCPTQWRSSNLSNLASYGIYTTHMAKASKSSSHGGDPDTKATSAARVLLNKYAVMSLGVFCMVVGFCLYAAGGIDLFRTALSWLRTGRWEAERTSAIIIRQIGPSNFRSWLESPEDWIGLHTAIETVCLRWPWFAVSIVYGMALFVYGGFLVLRGEDVGRRWMQRRT
jgi:DNA-binding XRE family transcriptional regulator